MAMFIGPPGSLLRRPLQTNADEELFGVSGIEDSDQTAGKAASAPDQLAPTDALLANLASDSDLAMINQSGLPLYPAVRERIMLMIRPGEGRDADTACYLIDDTS
jgi:hypothetical protein